MTEVKMSSTVFPGQHTTTTTITETETQVNPTIRFDKEYLNKLGGQLKAAEIILSIVALFIVSISIPHVDQYDRVAFFETVAVTAIWWNTIILVFYLFHVIEKFYKIPWLKVELVSNTVFAALYFLAALLSIAWIFKFAALFIFMLLASVALMLLFGYDAYMTLHAIQIGEIAQGVRVVSQVTEVNQPPYRY